MSQRCLQICFTLRMGSILSAICSGVGVIDIITVNYDRDFMKYRNFYKESFLGNDQKYVAFTII